MAKMPHGKKRQDESLTLAPLTFDEALAGLLATEPPAKPAKPTASPKPPKPAKRSKTTTRRKRTPAKPRPDTTH